MTALLLLLNPSWENYISSIESAGRFATLQLENTGQRSFEVDHFSFDFQQKIDFEWKSLAEQSSRPTGESEGEDR